MAPESPGKDELRGGSTFSGNGEVLKWIMAMETQLYA